MTTAELDKALVAEEALARELERYPGKWVAVKDGGVVASAETLRGLLDQVQPETLDRILEVSDEPAAGCFF